MSVIIRLSIMGKTHQRTFRVVAQDKKSKRDGKFLEILGTVNPHLKDANQVVIAKDKIAAWQKKGAQISPTVAFVIKNGKLPQRPKKDRKKDTQPIQTQPESPKPDSEDKEQTTNNENHDTQSPTEQTSEVQTITEPQTTETNPTSDQDNTQQTDKPQEETKT